MKNTGKYDIVVVPCPECGTKEEFESRSGACTFQKVDLKDCPDDIISDVNRYFYTCDKCGVVFFVNLATRKSMVWGK